MTISNQKIDVEDSSIKPQSRILLRYIVKMPKFLPRQRKHKVRKRLEQDNGIQHGGDSNAAEILPIAVTEKETKRQDMKNALRAQQPKISSKKQKRLDKYIVRGLVIRESHN